MVLSKRGICAFGWKAHDFALKGVDGKPPRSPTCARRRARSWFSSATIVPMWGRGNRPPSGRGQGAARDRHSIAIMPDDTETSRSRKPT